MQKLDSKIFLSCSSCPILCILTPKRFFKTKKLQLCKSKHTKNTTKSLFLKNKTPQLLKKINFTFPAHLHTTTDNIQKEFFKKQLPRFLKTWNMHRHNTKLYYRRLKSLSFNILVYLFDVKSLANPLKVRIISV